MTTKPATEVKPTAEASRVAEPTLDRPVYVPDTDIYERPDAIVVLADMPGVDEQHVELTLENNVLTLTGHQQLDEPKGHAELYRDYVPVDYRRSFTLNEQVDREHITAQMKNGVLRVVLPKAEAARPRRIEVTSG